MIEQQRYETMMRETQKFWRQSCSRCQAIHGTKLAGGGAVLLTENKVGDLRVLLCQKCGFDMVRQEIEKPVHGNFYDILNRKDVILDGLGLKQERLL